ncbi:ACP S-malonyltransferase [Spongiactinospora sp. 9N601]|uniref:ACP S-malonyltransferase n=1 Tax=Spongiactinospora sp. 9N601 TaxID=3375149 RepID=UPI0037A88E26
MPAFLFPGQGTVRVGMGGWLRRAAAAKDVFEAADELFSEPITPLCAQGPLDRLVATEHAQRAVTVCNLAALAVLRAEGHEPALVAGHSVGELSALHAAGVLGLKQTLRLVETRSRLMAAVGGTGGMSAVMGLPVGEVEELAAAAERHGEPLVVGLENAAGHVVVSGAFPALDRLAGLAPKVVPLKVGNAFHSPFMSEALPGWARAVLATPMRKPDLPVVPNVTAEPTIDLAVIRQALITQLTARVRWAETMAHTVPLGLCVEAGDSKVLAGLARAAGVRCLSMTDPATPRRLARERAA